MLDAILSFLSDLVGWLVGILPASPFQGLILGLSGDELVWLGWLNWCVPVGDMWDLFALWLLVSLTFAAAALSARAIKASAQLVLGR